MIDLLDSVSMFLCDSVSDVDATKDIFRVGLAVEDGLAFIVTLSNKRKV
jgi:hypothetical protein